MSLELMALYSIEWKASAKKELRKIDKQEIPKIIKDDKILIEIVRIRHRKDAYSDT